MGSLGTGVKCRRCRWSGRVPSNSHNTEFPLATSSAFPGAATGTSRFQFSPSVSSVPMLREDETSIR